MNERDAAKLAKRIPRESFHQVKVKRGKTNGRFTFHVIDTEPNDASRSSTTIYTLADWLVHPLNKLNKPHERRDQSLDEYIDGHIQSLPEGVT